MSDKDFTEYPNFADRGLGTTRLRELYLPQSLAVSGLTVQLYLPQSLAVSGLTVQLSNLPRWL